ncbi:hypothetical protein [Mucilaginibacter sp. FT3.2]|uniref:hypothetical protein n=1 Tax=Mucilaginibacter sp. FT3.2 TaxID=2723090 RepID=UPI0016144AC4|nr:hypothetical protein [Mucilaginibacter sp. FT3.2]MBB6234950.1 hypothetical protein [Mucilaginibacter sp. FT3.2]
MTKHLFSVVLFLVSISVQAQTTLSGINNSAPTVTLDVTGNPTATDYLDGIMAPRITGAQLKLKTYTVAENSAIVYVNTADPAPAGQTINVTAPGYYYFDGPTLSWVRFAGGAGAAAITGQVLTSDANGLGVWKALGVSSIPGTFPVTPVNFTSYGPAQIAGGPPDTILNTTAYITLPPGKWLVAFGTTAGIGYNGFYPRMLNTDASLWFSLYLSDDATIGGNTVDYITADAGPRGSGGILGRGTNKTYVSGSEAINNSSGGSKKYYLWAYQQQNINSSIPTSSKTQYDDASTAHNQVNAYWIGIMGVGYWERYFFAIPIQ